MLEQKIDELIVAINALTQRLETNNQSDAYRQAKAIEAEPAPTPAPKAAKPTTAANDPTFDDCKQLVLKFQDPKQTAALGDLLKGMGVSRLSELSEDAYPAFYKDASAILKEAV